MADYYTFTKKDCANLVSLFKEEDDQLKFWLPSVPEKKLLFLLDLSIDLLEEVARIRKLRNKVKEMMLSENLKAVDLLSEILKEWTEENNGNGNLLEVIKVLRSKGHLNFAKLAEQFLLRYSLPSKKNISRNAINVYTSSRDILQHVSFGQVPVWNANAADQALQNSVILEEIFKKLNINDQKAFRLVTPTWMKETFPYWRRSSMLQLRVPGSPDDSKIDGISMSSFLKLLDSEATPRKRKGKRNYELTEHPFRRCTLSYKASRGSWTEAPFSCGEREEKFWQLCGNKIEDLEMEYAYFGMSAENTVERVCQKIFLDTCPQLKKFKFGAFCRVEEDPTRGNSQHGVGDKKTTDVEKFNGKVASKLHTLTVEAFVSEHCVRNILCLTPNLKTLDLRTSWETTNGLIPNEDVNGACVKLKTLKIMYMGLMSHMERLLPLSNYAEMLFRKEIRCLHHLSLGGLFLNEARRPPFNLYRALARFSESLKTLELEMKVAPQPDMGEHWPWFADLSCFGFPNLTALKLRFIFHFNCDVRRVHFDLGTLKGMPMLEKLDFRVVNPESFVRRPGAEDWIFDGDRTEFLPEGITLDYRYPEAQPVLCKNLKQFTFMEWWLRTEDIKFLSACFPNLTYLKAAVQVEYLPLLLQQNERLEKLDILTKNLISLGNLRRIKQQNKGLRIFQTICGKMHHSVEMKEDNGRLYFC